MIDLDRMTGVRIARTTIGVVGGVSPGTTESVFPTLAPCSDAFTLGASTIGGY